MGRTLHPESEEGVEATFYKAKYSFVFESYSKYTTIFRKLRCFASTAMLSLLSFSSSFFHHHYSHFRFSKVS